MANVTITCLSETLSPLTHMSETSGNEAIIAREPVSTEYGIHWVPVISGNALRHKLVRSTGARYLVERLGLAGRLSLEQLNFLGHGGNLTQSTGTEDTRMIAEMQTLFPLLRLLGGAVPSQILSGSLHVLRGTLVCEENRSRVNALLPLDWELPESIYLTPAESFVAGYQYTRSDARKTVKDLLPELTEADKSNLMIFSGQQVMAGALFIHGFTILHGTQLEVGALLHSLSLWDGTIGGQASRGHGKLRTVILGDSIDTDAIQAYVEHVDEHAEECRQWLIDAFAPKKKTAKQAPLIAA